MRRTGLIPSNEATSLEQQSGGIATPRGAISRAAQQVATRDELAQVQDRSTSSQRAPTDREVRLGLLETTTGLHAR